MAPWNRRRYVHLGECSDRPSGFPWQHGRRHPPAPRSRARSRTARNARRGPGIAIDQQPVVARGEMKLVARDAGNGLESRPCGTAAVRAMAIHRVGEFIGHLVADEAAEALPGKRTSTCLFRICQGLTPCQPPPGGKFSEYLVEVRHRLTCTALDAMRQRGLHEFVEIAVEHA